MSLVQGLPPRGLGQTGGETGKITQIRGSSPQLAVRPKGPNNVVISSGAQSRREAWHSVAPQTSDTAVLGRSPDISEWRDAVLESTEVAADGQRLLYVQMNMMPVRQDRNRLYIAFETQSDQFPPPMVVLTGN